MHETPDLLSLQKDVLQREPDGENGIAPLYTRLRTMILDGVFPPGSMLSQVKLAESLGVSRIPLREALRMLQKEGLIEAEHNQRARVPAFEAATVDSLYASRMLLEVLGVRLTIPHIDQSDIQDLKQALAQLDEAAARKDLDLNAWEVPHRRFHGLLFHSVEDSLRQRIASLSDQCEYYRRLYYRVVSQHYPTRSAEVIAAEHHSIADACIQGKADHAAYLLASHYARTALTVIGQMAPEYDPVAVRVALQIIGSGMPLSEGAPSTRPVRKRQEAQMNSKRMQRM